MSTRKFEERIIEAAKDNNISIFSGVRNIDETRKAISMGSMAIKIYPCSFISDQQISEIIKFARTSLNTHIGIIASGGIKVCTIKNYLRMGADMVAVSEDLNHII